MPYNTLLFGCKLKEEGNSNKDICNIVKLKSMWRDNDEFKEYHSCQRGFNIAWKEDVAANDD